MKKILVGLLLLGMAAGSVFAQTLTLKGGVRSGLAVWFPAGDDKYTAEKPNDDGTPKMETQEPRLEVFSAGDDYAWRVNLEGAFSANEDDTAGFKFNLHFKNGNNVYAENGRAYLRVLDKKINFFAGKNDDPGNLGTRAGGVDDGLGIGGDIGLLTRFDELVPGLTLGLNIVPQINGWSINSGWTTTAPSLNPDGTVKQESTKYTGLTGLIGNASYRLGATYIVPDVVEVGLVFRTGAKYANNAKYGYVASTTAGDPPPDTEKNDMDVGIGFKVVALKDMGLTHLGLDLNYDDLALDTWNQIRIGQKIVYSKDAFEAGIRAQERMILGKVATDADLGGKDSNKVLTDNITMGLKLQAYIQYKLAEGNIIPKLELGYAIGGGGVTKPRTGAGDSINWETELVTDILSVPWKDRASMAIIPQVEFKIGGSGSIILGGGLYSDLSTKAVFPSGTDNKRADADPLHRAAFFADFKVSM